MRIRGTIYGMCYPCATTHVIGTPCPKSNPEFDIVDAPETDEEEIYTNDYEQEESEN